MRAGKVWKKLIAVLLAVVLSCFFTMQLVACSNKETPPAAPTETVTGEENKEENKQEGNVPDAGDNKPDDKPDDGDDKEDDDSNKPDDGDDKPDDGNKPDDGDGGDNKPADKPSDGNDDGPVDKPDDGNDDKNDEDDNQGNNTENGDDSKPEGKPDGGDDKQDEDSNKPDDGSADDKPDDKPSDGGDDKKDEEDEGETKPAATLNYAFSGANSADAGYAEGKITLTADSGTYHLYWADDTAALPGYYEIATLNITGASATYDFGYHTAIPAGATKLIAAKGTDKSVSGAVAVFDIPQDKRLANAGTLLYRFNSYSDVHIDKQGVYPNAASNWAQALNYAVNKGADFIVSSGDMVTNAEGPDDEWKTYRNVLAASEFIGPVWEANGNHDLRTGVVNGNNAFLRGTGADSVAASYIGGRPYFYMTEPTTGDLFIFMALENGYHASECDEFSAAQLRFVTELLDTYYNTGINIYIVEHAPISGFGTGDRMSDPYYKSHLDGKYATTKKLKDIFTNYPDIVWMSGHTHLDFAAGYNYSNENGTACHMIHNPSVAATTMPNAADTELDYNKVNNRILGFGSQGYYVETYENRIVYYGSDLTNELIYPAYCFIMEGGRTSAGGGPARETSATTSLSGKTLASALSAVKSKLDDEAAKTFASFDQYLTLKGLYKKYADASPADSAAAVDELGAAYDALKDVMRGVDGSTYYFVNNKGWDEVYCYAWASGDVKNRSYPGDKMQYVGKNGYGQDIYAIRFDSADKYEKVIFNNGKSSGSNQTVDIKLSDYSLNAFYPEDADNSGKLRVGSFYCDSMAKVYSEGERFKLCYYAEGIHDWDGKELQLRQREDGKFELEYTVFVESTEINFCIYNTVKQKYRCIASSTSVDHANGATVNKTFASESSTRGSSIKIKGLKSGDTITFVFDATANTIVMTFGRV